MRKSGPAWEGAFVIDTEGATGNTNGFGPPNIRGKERRGRNGKKTKENKKDQSPPRRESTINRKESERQ